MKQANKQTKLIECHSLETAFNIKIVPDDENF